MAKNLVQRPLIFEDENSDVYLKKGVISGKSKNGKPDAIKKGIIRLKSRNALNDITNKSTAPPEEATKKKGSQKELKVPNELNIAEETFQHDHKKCIEAQRSAMTLKHFLDLVLPGCDSASPIEMPTMDMGMSPPSSPKKRYSPPSSPFRWELEPVEFALKEENDC